ncbi:MAG: hypothetical protein ACJ75B_08585 [Flavisolibacter sp.]
MNEKKNDLVVRIHQAVILILFVFSLFVKEEVKKFFWLIIGTAVISLMIQSFVYRTKQNSIGDENHSR